MNVAQEKPGGNEYCYQGQTRNQKVISIHSVFYSFLRDGRFSVPKLFLDEIRTLEISRFEVGPERNPAY